MTRYLPDTNIWLALTVSGHTHHGAARQWFGGLQDTDEVMLCRATQQSLLRLLTTQAVFTLTRDTALTNVEAWTVVDAITADPRVGAISVEPPEIGPAWRVYSSLRTSSPKAWMDAYLAAFARLSGATLVTIDGAFRSYADLQCLVLDGHRAS